MSGLSNTQKRRNRRKIVKHQARLYRLIVFHWMRHQRWRRRTQQQLLRIENDRLYALRHTISMLSGITIPDVPGRSARDVLESIYSKHGPCALFSEGDEDKLLNEVFTTNMVLFALPVSIPTNTEIGSIVPPEFMSSATLISSHRANELYVDSLGGIGNRKPMDLFAVTRSDGTVRFAKMMGVSRVSASWIYFDVSVELDENTPPLIRNYRKSDELSRGIYTWSGIIAPF